MVERTQPTNYQLRVESALFWQLRIERASFWMDLPCSVSRKRSRVRVPVGLCILSPCDISMRTVDLAAYFLAVTISTKYDSWDKIPWPERTGFTTVPQSTNCAVSFFTDSQCTMCSMWTVDLSCYFPYHYVNSRLANILRKKTNSQSKASDWGNAIFSSIRSTELQQNTGGHRPASRLKIFHRCRQAI